LILIYSKSGNTAGGKTAPSKKGAAGEGPAVLWREPADIASRDLYYGPGGKAHEPHGTFTFESEDREGTNPKFDVVDQNGVKWRVKLGNEARPETAASRLVWAAGYFANEDYFMPVLQVQKMPHLHRGGSQVSSDGTVHNVRLKRRLSDEKKLGIWSWSDNPFKGSRELDGLRALMAVMNNWDLKDMNNAVFQVNYGAPEQRYMVSDLGATFGATGWIYQGKDNLKAYSRSKLIGSASDDRVDFSVPGLPAPERFFNVVETRRRLSLIWIGRNVPVSAARWMGNLLAKLSPKQIGDAFRASGYSPEEVEQLTEVVQRRIAELQKL
jgi:hypothetical protein